MGNYGSGYAYADPHAIPPHGWDSMQKAGVLVTPHTMLQVDVVYTALRIISNNIIKMGDLRSYTSKTDAGTGEPYKVYQTKQPAILTNTFGGGGMGGRAGTMMQCTGRDRTIWSMALFNEAYWYILARDKLERPAAIEVLHPAFMDVHVDKSPPHQLLYTYGSGKDKVDLEPQNVIVIPMKSLPAARRALSPVDYAGVATGLATAAYEFGSSWFAQGASPSFILSTEQKLGQDEVNRIAQKFLVEHSGLAQAHLPLVLDSGVKATKALNSPDEAQYLQTLEYSRQVLASWFGIPQGWMPNALLRDNGPMPHARQEEMISFQLNTLSGYTVPLEEAHAALVPGDNVGAEFNEHMLSKPDAQFLAQEIQALRLTQAASINDVRVRKLGWAPVKGGDEVIAPYASNVAPGQGGQGAQSDGSQSPASGTNNDSGSGSGSGSGSDGSDSDEERQALMWLLKRVARDATLAQ
jgi:HK97 family phage portal protein